MIADISFNNNHIIDKKYRVLLKQINASSYIYDKYKILNEEKLNKLIDKLKKSYISKTK